MSDCNSCKYETRPIDMAPCNICARSLNFPLWQPKMTVIDPRDARIEELQAELARLRDEKETSCQWELEYEPDDGIWRPSCSPDELWQFSCDGPIENGMKFCLFCGRPLVVVHYPPEAP